VSARVLKTMIPKVDVTLANMMPSFSPVSSIGRVTEGVLLPIADEVDIVEPVAKFTAGLKEKPGVRSVANVGLGEWQPDEGACYDLVWIQWCLGYLNDEQVVGLLRRCAAVLDPEGVVVVKENQSTHGEDVLDLADASITR
jgi:protein N-terminal methyltransferase